jgi:hypothetical protein
MDTRNFLAAVMLELSVPYRESLGPLGRNRTTSTLAISDIDIATRREANSEGGVGYYLLPRHILDPIERGTQLAFVLGL